MQVKSVRDVDVSGKRVLLRVDFNVPLKDGKVADDTRIRAALPTIKWLLEKGAQVSLLTHLGRPEGKVVEGLRTAPLAARLTELLPNAPVTMLENVRFDAGDENNDEAYAKKLAEGYDIFVNDAFAVSHRAHASVVGVTKFLPSYAGFLIEEEIDNLSQALTPPQGAVAIIGGAKYETKAPLIEKFSNIYSKVFVGGNLANEFQPTQRNVFLPIDAARDETHAADIGPNTIETWAREIKATPFVLWNGPVGMYEDERFKIGTDKIAEAIVSTGVRAVVGGGDTVAAIQRFTFDPNKVFISTGGGAMLEFLIQGTLPGLEPLKA
jgi:phosphoglycerate kinase